ncbi:MAG: transcription antitermination factor NusB [bacterium]|nr:transcription antitermination factor NusB [bacterium]
MGKRRQARELTMIILYQADVCRIDPDEAIELLQEECEVAPEMLPFVRDLVHGALANLEVIDSLIDKFSDNWTLDRMPAIDRNILRMTVQEMLFMPEIPHNVSINEAIELANTFSTQDSGRFVNGILDSIYKDNCEGDNGGADPVPAMGTEGVKRGRSDKKVTGS